MKRKLLFLLLYLCGYSMAYPQLVQVGEGYSNTSVNTTVFRNSSLVTDGDVQYISYYDPEGYLVLGKMKPACRRTHGNDTLHIQKKHLARLNGNGIVQDFVVPKTCIHFTEYLSF